jgi:hypothetical protein
MDHEFIELVLQKTENCVAVLDQPVTATLARPEEEVTPDCKPPS